MAFLAVVEIAFGQPGASDGEIADAQLGKHGGAFKRRARLAG